ncbi:uncharacterized protein BDR25DRAFT_99683 [Lindgomyces ingoldianus]|uniref:Uncharacterized protein n=1 Tax=Lindgomyces ingoldianus TaxID=673940 RepID=A0ACB6QDC6_9PLEO|nr:uncharacterized protein BDR25DRAFT_99683 [Lindgomyces ingoldianus]KAF2464122.1 hypothetical protein BDR25DRAFT_99683 [Lindgomyces ingoldianus]
MDTSQTTTDTSNRFALITHENISGYLWIASILCPIYAFLVIFIRWHIKWNLYGLDDATATLATFLQLGGCIPLFLAMNHGLGKSDRLVDAAVIDEAGKTTFIAQIFLLASLATAKCSVAYLLLRLFTRDLEVTRKPWLLCNGTLALTIVWGIGSIIAISAGCQPSALLQDGSLSHCSNQLTRWRVITCFDIFIELLLILLPVFFIWPIQMKRYIKVQVVIAFGLRAPVIVFTATRLHYITSYTNSTNTRYSIIPALAYLQLEVFWALLAATIPTLKAFMRSFNSGFGMEIDLDGYGSVSGYHQGSIPLQSLSKSNTRHGTSPSRFGRKTREDSSALDDTREEVSKLVGSSIRPDNVGTQTSIYHPERAKGANSVGSDGSQEMIIKREVQWTVWHEESKP